MEEIPGYPLTPVRTPAQTRALVEVLNGHDLRRIQISHGRSYAAVQVIRDEYRLHDQLPRSSCRSTTNYRVPRADPRCTIV